MFADTVPSDFSPFEHSIQLIPFQTVGLGCAEGKFGKTPSQPYSNLSTSNPKRGISISRGRATQSETDWLISRLKAKLKVLRDLSDKSELGQDIAAAYKAITDMLAASAGCYRFDVERYGYSAQRLPLRVRVRIESAITAANFLLSLEEELSFTGPIVEIGSAIEDEIRNSYVKDAVKNYQAIASVTGAQDIHDPRAAIGRIIELMNVTCPPISLRSLGKNNYDDLKSLFRIRNGSVHKEYSGKGKFEDFMALFNNLVANGFIEFLESFESRKSSRRAAR